MHSFVNTDPLCKACGHPIGSERALSVHSHVASFTGGFVTCAACGSESVHGEVDYQRLYTSRDSTNYPATNGFLVKLKRHLLKRTAANILRGRRADSKVLDFGCGGGELANAMHSIGFRQVHAADVQAQRPPSLDAGIPYLTTEGLASQRPYDVVILRHVIEHLERPAEVLAGIRENLAPDGIMIVEFPSAASAWKRLMRSRWTGYFFPYHTLVLSESGARHIFERAKLKVERVEQVEPPIFGVYLMTFGMPRWAARICSVMLFPLQALVSKVACRSEALVFVLTR